MICISAIYTYKPLIFAFAFIIFWSVLFLSNSCACLAKFCPLVVLELWGELYGTVRIAWLVSWFLLSPVSTKNLSPWSVSNIRNLFLTAASATVARMQSSRMLPLDWVKQPYLSTCIMVILCFKQRDFKHFTSCLSSLLFNNATASSNNYLCMLKPKDLTNYLGFAQSYAAWLLIILKNMEMTLI